MITEFLLYCLVWRNFFLAFNLVTSLEANVLAEICVAFATLILSCFTYRSVIASENQVKMSQLEKQRPMVLEFINKHLNQINQDLLGESKVIDQNVIYWHDNYSSNHDLGTIIFPLPPSKKFYSDYLLDKVPYFLKINPEIIDRLYLIMENLQKRMESYKFLNNKIQLLLNELSDEICNEVIDRAVTDGPEILDFFHIERKFDPKLGNEKFTVKYGIRSGGNQFSKNELLEYVKTLIIIAIFQSRIDSDYRFSKKKYPFPPGAMVDLIKSIIIQTDFKQMNSVKKDIDDKLSELKQIDTEILKDITSLKINLRETYLFTDNELEFFSE